MLPMNATNYHSVPEEVEGEKVWEGWGWGWATKQGNGAMQPNNVSPVLPFLSSGCQLLLQMDQQIKAGMD